MDLEDELRHALQDPTRGPSPDFGDRVLAALPARQRPLLWPLRALAAPLGAAAMVVAIVLAVGVIGPATGPNRSAVPLTASPGATATSAATSGTYPDGIPRQIDGQPVLRGEAILSHVAQSQDATPFLVGGYVYAFYADCYVEPGAPGSPLLAPCDDGFHLGDAPPGTGGGFGPRLVVDAALQDLPGSAPGVLRVHVHDRRAVDCAPAIRQRCEEAIVVEAVVWTGAATVPLDADGIPRELDGDAVLRGYDIAVKVAAAGDDAPFLVGGWATGPMPWLCPASTPTANSTSLLLCSLGTAIQLMDGPDHADGMLVMSIDQGPLPAPGAVVLRVHVHDALAASCPETNRTLCEQMLVLDGVVWTQPSAPATPLP
jgi:hypothetical protein